MLGAGARGLVGSSFLTAAGLRNTVFGMLCEKTESGDVAGVLRGGQASCYNSGVSSPHLSLVWDFASKWGSRGETRGPWHPNNSAN